MRFCMRCLQHTLAALFPLLSCDSSDPLRRLRSVLSLIDPPERPADRLRPRVDITHRGLDGVVPGDVLQRKGVRVLSRLRQKRVAQSVKSSIRIDHNLITGKLFRETPHFRFKHPGLELLVRVARLAEDMAAFGLGDEVLRIDFDSSLILSTRRGPPLEPIRRCDPPAAAAYLRPEF